MSVEHGGTDSGPRPAVDVSTNANPYGPSPTALVALRADVGPYPDPAAVATRQRLANHHDVDLDTVVVGAGATELIDRLVRTVGGPVLVEQPTFGEYAGAAARHGVELRRAAAPDAFLDALGDARLAFVCSPGNPDGRVRDAAWCDRVAERAAETGTVVVVDLAYAPLAEVAVPAPVGAVELHAPNKAHGCTGLRAGWLAAPAALAERLREAAVTWSVSTPGLSFLAGTATRAADAWVDEHRALLLRDRDGLAAGLRAAGLDVTVGAAPFLLVAVPDGDDRSAAARCRADHGVKVRPCTSLGLPGVLRVATPRTEQLGPVVAALTATLGPPVESR